MTANEEEFQRLRRRFGDDISAWPAPYRRLAEPPPGEDPVDRLVRTAAVDKVEDHRLAGKVLDGLGADRTAGAGAGWLSSPFASPRLAAAGLLLLTGAALTGGYRFAGGEDRSVEASLFAVAAGAPTAFLFGDGFDRPEGSL